ncbi:MAG: murein biosynthesis integral membrane protein MurJ [Anaerolineales bacterium]|nr:murein biosynthesis integral membrane protein MurJ [Anaerolineales bacterium]
MDESSKSGAGQIARAASVVMAAFVLSNLIGLVRQMLVSRAFGTTTELDAFNAAATYPDLIFSLVAGGALASAFVPTLTGLIARGDRQDGWRLSSAIINLVFLILSILSLVSALLAPQIVHLILAPNNPPQVQDLTADLLRILLIAPTIFGVSGLIMGILNAHQVFLWPALAPSMLWIGMIIGVLFLAPGMGIFGLAWGYVLGALLHFGIQLPGLFRLPARRFYRSLGLGNAAVREVGRLMGPRLLGVAAVQLNFVVNTILAFGMAEGSLAALKYAWAIMTMPQVVIAQAIAIAALPTFSAQVAQGRLNEMSATLASTLRGVILLALPASLGLIILRKPVIELLFQRGAFSAESTELVAWALLWYTAGLLGHSVVEILSRAFYALHDTKTPVLISIGAMGMNIAFSLVFPGLFNRLGWFPFGGLALANSLATAIEMVFLWLIMRRRLGSLQGSFIMDGGLKSALAGFLMSLVLWGWLIFTQRQSPWLVGVGGILVGGSVFTLAVWLLRIRELRVLVEVVQARLKRAL